ncbi:hypothetical protein YW7DRAFT_05242 [Streptomyces sp. AmelKG-E11A]|nr:hypothetical protein YW7DRAFT_05242 [Streptomyces sp. AmelKG-E11A]
MGLGDRHQKKDVEAALRRAEAAGLKVKHDKNRHRWGWVLCCPCNEDIVVSCPPRSPEERPTALTPSHDSTETMRAWYFTLVLSEPLTPEQKNFLDGLDRFADGEIGLTEKPGRSAFLCAIPAESLDAAVANALARFEDFPGVLVRSVELDEIALDQNSMATPAVFPAPPPVAESPSS